MGDLGKLIVTKAFKKLPKVQKSPNLVTLHAPQNKKSTHFGKIELNFLIQLNLFNEGPENRFQHKLFGGGHSSEILIHHTYVGIAFR